MINYVLNAFTNKDTNVQNVNRDIQYMKAMDYVKNVMTRAIHAMAQKTTNAHHVQMDTSPLHNQIPLKALHVLDAQQIVKLATALLSQNAMNVTTVTLNPITNVFPAVITVLPAPEHEQIVLHAQAVFILKTAFVYHAQKTASLVLVQKAMNAMFVLKATYYILVLVKHVNMQQAL